MIDFKLLGGFDNGQTDEHMDICTSRVAFATENLSFQSCLLKLSYEKIETENNVIYSLPPP